MSVVRPDTQAERLGRARDSRAPALENLGRGGSPDLCCVRDGHLVDGPSAYCNHRGQNDVGVDEIGLHDDVGSVDETRARAVFAVRADEDVTGAVADAASDVVVDDAMVDVVVGEHY